MYFQPVSSNQSAIGRAVAAGINQAGNAFGLREEEERRRQELAAQERLQGIIPMEDVRRSERLVAEQGPTVDLPVPQMPQQSPIARAVGANPPPGAPMAQMAIPGARPAQAQMSGPISRREEVEEHIDLGDGRAYAPSRDVGFQMSQMQAKREQEAASARQAEAMNAVLPAAQRFRDGTVTTEDLLLLNAAGISLDDLEDPESKLNRAIAEAYGTAQAGEAAREPYRIAGDERSAANAAATDERRHGQTLAEIGIRGEEDRRTASTRAASQNVNWETNPETAEAYGLALAHVQAGGRLPDGTTVPATVDHVIKWLTEGRTTRHLPRKTIIAIAAQAFRDARGTMPRESASSGTAYTPGQPFVGGVNREIVY